MTSILILVAFTAGWAGCRIAYHRDHRRLAVDQLRFANKTAATQSTTGRRRARNAARLSVIRGAKP